MIKIIITPSESEIITHAVVAFSISSSKGIGIKFIRDSSGRSNILYRIANYLS